MPDWDDNYPLEAYNDLQQYIAGVETQQADALGAWLIDRYHPASVVDVGCGPGIYLLPFKRAGVTVWGIDGAPAAGAALDSSEFARCDFRDILGAGQLFNSIEPYQQRLVLCIETAEHLPAYCAEPLIDWLCHLAAVVCFSAAAPGQGGTGHINCQPREYWRGLFAQRRYRMSTGEESLLRYLDTQPGIFDWLRNNLMLLEREQERIQ